jgi:mRNA interferase MazF
MKPGEAMAYVPDSGDIVWIMFTPQAGHEQAGRRPALVLSPKSYNSKVGLALLKEAITGYLDSLKAHGEPVPPPISEEIVDVSS